MATPNNLDVQHIRMIAEAALTSHRPSARLHPIIGCTADEDGVSVAVRSVGDVAPVERALRQHGYATTNTGVVTDADGRRLGTRVTGWFPARLRNRTDELAAAAVRLTGSFEVTVDHAISTYRNLRADGFDADAARQRAGQRVERDLNKDAAREIGPLVHKKLTPDHPEIAALLADNDRLYSRVIHLLYRHARIAAEAIDTYARHEPDHTHDEARARTLNDLRPRITATRVELERAAVRDRYADAHAWATEHAAGIAAGFANWYADNVVGPNPAPMDQAFRRWAAFAIGDDTLTDGAAARPANEAARIAATDFPVPGPPSAAGPEPDDPAPAPSPSETAPRRGAR